MTSIILVVVEGGPGTLQTVYSSVQEKTPALVIAVCITLPLGFYFHLGDLTAFPVNYPNHVAARLSESFIQRFTVKVYKRHKVIRAGYVLFIYLIGVILRIQEYSTKAQAVSI